MIQIPICKLKPHEERAYTKAMQESSLLVWPQGSLVPFVLHAAVGKAITGSEVCIVVPSPKICPSISRKLKACIPQELIESQNATSVTFESGSICIISADSPEFEGASCTLLVDYQLFPRVPHKKPWIISGTPMGMGNVLYEAYLDFGTQDSLLTCYDVFSSDRIAKAKDQLTPELFKQDYLCDFRIGNSIEAHDSVNALAKMQFHAAVSAGERWAVERALGYTAPTDEKKWELEIHHVETAVKGVPVENTIN